VTTESRPLALSAWLKLITALPLVIVSAWLHEPALVATWIIVGALGVAQLAVARR